MAIHPAVKLNPRKKYLQVALNSTLEEAKKIIHQLPISDRIIVEAGTPLIKRYGENGIRKIRQWYEDRILGKGLFSSMSGEWESRGFENNLPLDFSSLSSFTKFLSKSFSQNQPAAPAEILTPPEKIFMPYIVADLKTMDRGSTEVEMAKRAGASAAVACGQAPVETLDSFIASCEANGLDAMIDMMNVEFPLSVLRALKKVPPVVILHRGVDEEKFNKQKQIPLHEIRRIKGNYNIMISIAGGDTPREVQRSIFNDADIVVIWKSVFQSTDETVKLVEEFLKDVK